MNINNNKKMDFLVILARLQKKLLLFRSSCLLIEFVFLQCFIAVINQISIIKFQNFDGFFSIKKMLSPNS